MAKYRLTAPAIIDDAQREVGFEFEFDGVPGPHMEPLDDAAKKAVAERDKAAQPAIEPDMRAHPEEAARPGAPTPRAEAKPADKEEDRAGPGGHRRG
jgi:predicted  nucleic acid-binding Zn-ribbon protein